MNWNEYPWVLENRTIEKPVSCEDGGEDALLFSISHDKPAYRFSCSAVSIRCCGQADAPSA